MPPSFYQSHLASLIVSFFIYKMEIQKGDQLLLSKEAACPKRLHIVGVK